jgi:hypothetical protein
MHRVVHSITLVREKEYMRQYDLYERAKGEMR